MLKNQGRDPYQRVREKIFLDKFRKLWKLLWTRLKWIEWSWTYVGVFGEECKESNRISGAFWFLLSTFEKVLQESILFGSNKLAFPGSQSIGDDFDSITGTSPSTTLVFISNVKVLFLKKGLGRKCCFHVSNSGKKTQKDKPEGVESQCEAFPFQRRQCRTETWVPHDRARFEARNSQLDFWRAENN